MRSTAFPAASQTSRKSNEMAQRFTILLVGITLLVVLFTAYMTIGVREKMDTPILSGQTFKGGGVETERWLDESLEHWYQRHKDAVEKLDNAAD